MSSFVLCTCVVSVPGVVVQNVAVADVSSDTATLSWQWRKSWLEEQGQINEIKGEFIGFKVTLNT